MTSTMGISQGPTEGNLFTISDGKRHVSASLPANFTNDRNWANSDGTTFSTSLTADRSSSVSSSAENPVFFKAEDTMCEMTDVNEIALDPEAPLHVNGDPETGRRRHPEGMGQQVYEMSSGRRKADEPFHCHIPRPGINKTARNQLAIVTVLCFIFMIGEIIGGRIANSLALISDATHLASDLSGFLVSLFAISVAGKRPTARLSFGYYRAEVLGALVSILIIWITTGVLVYLAVRRVIHQDYTIEADIMLITAGAGVAFNIVMGLVLTSSFFGCQAIAHAHSHGGHGHSHGGSHQHEDEHGHSHDAENANHNNNQPNSHLSESNEEDGVSLVGKPKKKDANINVRAAFIHIIGDLFQSIGVLIAAFIIKFKPEYKIADPICTFVFSVLVPITTITILRDTILLLLEGVPRSIDYRMCKFDLETLDGVRAVHSLNIWALSPDRIVVAVHIVRGETYTESKELVKNVTMLLRKKYNAFHTTVQLEHYEEELMADCEDCLGPKLC